jgi:acyl-CoA thioesterase
MGPAALDEAPMHPLDEATRLRPAGAGSFTGRTSEAYWNFAGPFGGVTAGTLMGAVLAQERRLGDPCALTVNFTARIAAGAFTVALREVRTGRSVQHWYAELAQGDVVAANATIVCARREETWRHHPVSPPAAPPPEHLAPLPTAGRNAFLSQFEFRFAAGAPDFGPRFDGRPRSARSCVWLNNAIPRPWDFTALAVFCDLFFGRIFHVQGTVFPAATVSLTAYFHVAAAALAALGAEPLLGVADATIFEAGFFDQTAQLWSRAGRLLATTTQIVSYRA